MPSPEQAEQQAKDQFTRGTKVFMAFMWMIPGLLTGALVRLFVLPTDLGGVTAMLVQYLPWMGGFALLFAAFAWYFPQLSAFILEMLLGIEISRE